MSKEKYPMTAGVRFLQGMKIDFTPFMYEYKDHGGALWAADALSLDPASVVKTLLFETDEKKPLMVLMHGDKEVSTKNLARFLGVKTVLPCSPEKAEKLTGYQVGGISPFGSRSRVPVYAEATLFTLPKIFINGGKRGFLVGIDPAVLKETVEATEISVATTS